MVKHILPTLVTKLNKKLVLSGNHRQMCSFDSKNLKEFHYVFLRNNKFKSMNQQCNNYILHHTSCVNGQWTYKYTDCALFMRTVSQ